MPIKLGRALLQSFSAKSLYSVCGWLKSALKSGFFLSLQ